MGAYLDKPNEDKNPEHGTHDQCWWGLCSMQGWRCNQEDAHIASNIDLPGGERGMLFAVFDGHGGKEVAEFANQRFQAVLTGLQEFKNKQYEKALETAFLNFDAEVKTKEYADDTGCTSCVILLTPTIIYCANAGDSRAVLKSGETAVGLSEDHKPDNVGEQTRIQKAHHFVSESRVDGNLALSRAFGDFQFKDQAGLQPQQQAVSCFPDVTKRNRNKDDQFIMLACDGIWDCLNNQECVDTLTKKINKTKNYTHKKVLSKPVEDMFGDILAPNTEDGIGTDNMTAILIYFHENMGINN